LILGSRSFSAEIAAAAAAFFRESALPSSRLLFIRSVRKLLVRFSSAIWEDEPKLAKLSGLIEGLDGDLDEFMREDQTGGNAISDNAKLKKICESIRKNALKLEMEGIGDLIPVSHIRRAAWWSRLAPAGKQKLLLIENADRMQEGGRNALLKILEEPPERVRIVLTTAHGGALLPTIVSRLRPYRFYPRDAATEKEVIRRVFRDSSASGTAAPETGGDGEPRRAPKQSGMVTAYLDSFLPVSGKTLSALAAFFAASLAYQGALALRKRGAPELPEPLIALGKYAAPIAGEAGFERVGDIGVCVAQIVKEADNFEFSRLFSRFLASFMALVSGSMRSRFSLSPGNGGDSPAGWIGFTETLKQLTSEADAAVGTYNQSPALALERFGAEFRRIMADI
jgi:DNA polymerase-3 subunit gamma/tau